MRFNRTPLPPVIPAQAGIQRNRSVVGSPAARLRAERRLTRTFGEQI